MCQFLFGQQYYIFNLISTVDNKTLQFYKNTSHCHYLWFDFKLQLSTTVYITSTNGRNWLIPVYHQASTEVRIRANKGFYSW